MILPTSYFGNIEYFYLIAKSKEITIDHAEPWQKQTYRNRCEIVGSNGLQNLIVPVYRPNGNESFINEIEISYAEDWIKNHIKTIESAYARTPYFEYYTDKIFDIISEEHKLLIDLNRELIEYFIDKLGLTCQPDYSKEKIPLQEKDPRQFLSPKIESGFNTHRYIQTFEERHGFQSNLSILDLLFNEGPNSISILSESKYITS